ncbi:phage scaffolding protein [Variovorax sp. GB1P17]|uniref:phage scaffolding protein n=1 Tax=Variovorax sp. GB1P17 TaxID=3443740 RepID=UPI003F455976
MPPFNRKYAFFNADPGAGGGGTPTAPPEPQTFTLEYVKELRNENKGWRLKADELTKERDTHKTAAEKAALEADEKVKSTNTAAEQRVIRAEMKAAALKAGMVDLDGLKLADLSKIKLTEAGEVEGAEALMDELKKSKPYLFGAPSTSNTQEPPPREKPAAKKVSEMTTAEYETAKAKLTAT